MQAVGLPVDLHRAAGELPAHKGGFPLAGQLLYAAAYLPDIGVVIRQLPGQKGASSAAPGHAGLERLNALLGEVGTALQRLVLAVVGIYRFHHFLCGFQLFQLGLQFINGVGVVGADAAHTGAADFIKQTLNILPFPHILIIGGVLLLLFLHGEIGRPGNHHGGDTGGDLIAFIHVLCQQAGVGVKKLVYLIVKFRVNPLFLPLGDLHRLVHHAAILRRGAAGPVVVKAVGFLGTAGRSLVDGVIADGGLLRGFRLFRGVGLRRLSGNRLPGFLLGRDLTGGRGIVQNAVDHVFVLLGGQLGGTQGIFPQELRHFPEPHIIAKMGLLPVAMAKHHHIGNGQAASLEVGGVVGVELVVNAFQRVNVPKRGGIYQVIIRRVNRPPGRQQAIIRLKAEIPCFRPAPYLIDGKGVVQLLVAVDGVHQGGGAFPEGGGGLFVVPDAHDHQLKGRGANRLHFPDSPADLIVPVFIVFHKFRVIGAHQVVQLGGNALRRRLHGGRGGLGLPFRQRPFRPLPHIVMEGQGI